MGRIASSGYAMGSRTIAEVAERFFNEHRPAQRPLDSIIDKVIDCRTAGEVVVRLTR
jgi:hypothetical protein